MRLQSVTERHIRRQKAISKRTADQIAKLWSAVDSGHIAASWRLLIPNAMTVLSTSQATSAASAGVYVDDALFAQGITADAVGRVVPTAFAAVASDGRELPSLLYQPAIRALVALQKGADLPRARSAGLLSLDSIVRTQVADAGRTAEAVAITARPQVTGYVRMLSLPSCSRCVLLAGRRYRWNQGFQRHPRCDCRHIPAIEDSADDARTDPRAAFDAMDAAEQDRVFTKAGADAIRDGADIAKVVNARRGMQDATVFGRKTLITHEAAGKRVRLMPEEIMKEADGNRTVAIRLLRFHGYIR